MTGRRGLFAAMAGCAVGGGLALLAAGRTWGSATVVSATGAHLRVVASGSDVVPAMSALGLAMLVLAGALVAARSWLRRLIGLVVVVVGGAAISLALTSHDDVVAGLDKQAFGVQHAVSAPAVAGWAVVAAFAGLLAVVAGAAAVVFGAVWPALGARYDAPATTRVEPVVSAWDALDRGEDPTT
jgi:uncharacterized membrane protein (TIGR02234 family)